MFHRRGCVHCTLHCGVVYIMAAHEHAILSFYCFLMGVSSCLGLLFVRDWTHLAALLPAFAGVDYIYLKCFLKDEAYMVGVRAAGLGLVFSVGVMVIDLGNALLQPFGWYTCILSMFHFSEYLAIAITNPQSLSVRSFVLDNGWEYKVAAVLSWAEFFIEFYVLPGLKSWYLVSAVGLTMCIAGEFLRKLAMWTASTNFNHIVQNEKAEGHVLVTHGVYHYVRHPSYVGWFYWSVGTQLLLMNPICLIGYTLASWNFFCQRIYYEEITLLNFFGKEYHDYQQKTGTGLPFIKGYLLDE